MEWRQRLKRGWKSEEAIEAAGVAKKIGKVYKSVKGKSLKVSD